MQKLSLNNDKKMTLSYFELTLKMLMLGELTLLDLGGKKNIK